LSPDAAAKQNDGLTPLCLQKEMRDDSDFPQQKSIDAGWACCGVATIRTILDMQIMADAELECVPIGSVSSVLQQTWVQENPVGR
jgi:hypothetical protein